MANHLSDADYISNVGYDLLEDAFNSLFTYGNTKRKYAPEGRKKAKELGTRLFTIYNNRLTELSTGANNKVQSMLTSDLREFLQYAEKASGLYAKLKSGYNFNAISDRIFVPWKQ